MKKSILIILVVAILALSLSACDTEITGDIYAKLNKLCDLNYTSIRLDVETHFHGVRLKNTYTANTASNNTMVSYSIQELAEITTDKDGNIIMPEEMITTKTGSAIVVNGQIVAGDTSIPVQQLENINLKFKKEFFDVDATDRADKTWRIFSATVTNIKGFTGNNNFDATSMSVEVRYYENYVNNIVIRYTTSNGASITVIYSLSL